MFRQGGVVFMGLVILATVIPLAGRQALSPEEQIHPGARGRAAGRRAEAARTRGQHQQRDNETADLRTLPSQMKRAALLVYRLSRER